MCSRALPLAVAKHLRICKEEVETPPAPLECPGGSCSVAPRLPHAVGGTRGRGAAGQRGYPNMQQFIIQPFLPSAMGERTGKAVKSTG